ncbi:hypothetical protein FHX14_004119 [Rhizobium sp. BK619]|uniref:Uncharacterized protein n=2 Tax=Rhizobium leguminosarum TaxID=384 RepID=I9XED5_RHILT|nr:hypothetical protein Rleg9DRAFT_6474 [Rhizobium leguminosarum bv. trifolii WSM597]MBB3647901.1 hypothetical protein [Rhizobium sp. BK619]MBB5666874.1 hypothetical protein [Rhizobium leguminosarum]MBB6224504.1 hypothetical protein [Rhizobium leguminosarum]
MNVHSPNDLDVVNAIAREPTITLPRPTVEAVHKFPGQNYQKL